MGKLIYSMVTSLDGYVADERGDFGSWARPDEEVLAAVNDQTAQVGTFLYGRRMYQLMSVWETDPQVVAQSPGSADFARLWQRADKVVFSTTIQHVPTARTVLYRQFDPQLIADLKDSGTADVTIEGPTLAAEAFRDGLVDEIRPIVCPVSLGGGQPFLPRRQRHDLRFLGEQRFGNGVAEQRYAVVGP